MSPIELKERVAQRQLGPREVVNGSMGQLSLSFLKPLSGLPWRVTHRKTHRGGTSVLRYAIEGEKAFRLIEKVEHLHPNAPVSLKDQTEDMLSIEIDIGSDGVLHLEILFSEEAESDELAA
jgi:hypothetical protein